MDFISIALVFLALFIGIYIGKKLVEGYYKVKLKEWILEKDGEIRGDAVKRSRVVLGGKFLEQLAPFLPGFKYDPTDARFIGSPVDFVVFDGLSKGEPGKVVFIEVKSGQSRLSKIERKVKEAVKGKRVEWEELKADV
jgi:predicted Holliday junction resolvase-like endonuclease